MISRSECQFSATAGATLFEILVVLLIVSAATGVAVAGLRAPSARLLVESDAQAFVSEAQRSRFAAMQSGEEVSLHGPGCDAPNAASLHFFADGSARGDAICFVRGSFRATVLTNPLIGSLSIRIDADR